MTSEELLERARGGDGDSFGALVEGLGLRLLLLIQRRGSALLGADLAAEDLLQETLCKAWTLLPEVQLDRPGAFYPWLAALARGLLADRAKYLHAKARGSVRHVESHTGLAVYDSRTSVSRIVARKLEVERALAALAQLSPAQREVVEGHLLDGRSLSELAAELQVSKSAVWDRLQRGMARLQGALS